MRQWYCHNSQVVRLLSEDNETPACQNSEEIENPDSFSYLTEAHQERGPVRLLIMERFRAVDTAPRRQDTTFEEPRFCDIKAGHLKESSKDRHCTNKDGVEENEESQPAESYLSEAPKCSSTYQGRSLIITGQFKFIYGSP